MRTANRSGPRLTNLDLVKSDTSKYVVLRQIRGKLIKRSGGELSVVATGRHDWVGWLELRDEHVEDAAIANAPLTSCRPQSSPAECKGYMR